MKAWDFRYKTQDVEMHQKSCFFSPTTFFEFEPHCDQVVKDNYFPIKFSQYIVIDDFV